MRTADIFPIYATFLPDDPKEPNEPVMVLGWSYGRALVVDESGTLYEVELPSLGSAGRILTTLGADLGLGS